MGGPFATADAAAQLQGLGCNTDTLPDSCKGAVEALAQDLAAAKAVASEVQARADRQAHELKAALGRVSTVKDEKKILSYATAAVFSRNMQ